MFIFPSQLVWKKFCTKTECFLREFFSIIFIKQKDFLMVRIVDRIFLHTICSSKRHLQTFLQVLKFFDFY
ncbi:unnamed protein product [Larinioides sclopetarius]|uniref:Uncharacterized protein n=1 Tax=Larinioides sclopetarius TaxID=280406 RepID=A0AAV2AEI8_9ARAC